VTPSRVALLGLGEVGSVLVEDLRGLGHGVAAYDIAWSDDSSIARRNAESLDVPMDSLAAALEGADLVVSAVTPGSCVAVARASAGLLRTGAWYVDLNSASPGHKVEAAALVEAGGGWYVEVALMSAIAPRRLSAPFLLGGPRAEAFAEAATEFGLLDVSVVPGPLGRAAATKLCRSVVVKGLEALFTESLTAARHHGVEAAVLASLSNILPPADWEAVADYFVARSQRHGRRRSEEMLEAAATVAESGLDPLMALATAERQALTGRGLR
jgi:3-hydroxyisobutyrate dehydrogenase-like beta-hydroxyacid dehydrogenase